MSDTHRGRRPAVPADREALRRRVRHPYITRQRPAGDNPDASADAAAADEAAADAPTTGADDAAHGPR